MNGINSNIDVGSGIHPYQFGWLLGFVGTALVYTALSLLLPAKETFIDKALRPDEIFIGQGEEVERGSGSEEVETEVPEKKGFRQRAERFL